MPTIYMIRHSVTGLYSKGGTDGDKWHKTGKVWTSIGALKNHLRLYQTGGRYMNRPIPPEWEVVFIDWAYITDSERTVNAASLMPVKEKP